MVETSGSRKRRRDASGLGAEAPSGAAEAAATETVAAPPVASTTAPPGSRHCDREAALRSVIAMGFTPQRAARLQKQAASPGSDGIGDTEKLIAVLLGEPAAAAAPQQVGLDLERAASPANVAETVTMDLTQEEEDYVPSQSQTQPQPQPAAAFRRSSSDDLVATEAPAAHNNLALAQLAEMGFGGSVAERALKSAGGDVQEALSRLLYRASVL